MISACDASDRAQLGPRTRRYAPLRELLSGLIRRGDPVRIRRHDLHIPPAAGTVCQGIEPLAEPSRAQARARGKNLAGSHRSRHLLSPASSTGFSRASPDRGRRIALARVLGKGKTRTASTAGGRAGALTAPRRSKTQFSAHHRASAPNSQCGRDRRQLSVILRGFLACYTPVPRASNQMRIHPLDFVQSPAIRS